MATTRRWRATVGLTFPKGRVETGQLVPIGFDVPDWLIEQGKVEPAKPKAGD